MKKLQLCVGCVQPLLGILRKRFDIQEHSPIMFLKISNILYNLLNSTKKNIFYSVVRPLHKYSSSRSFCSFYLKNGCGDNNEQESSLKTQVSSLHPSRGIHLIFCKLSSFRQKSTRLQQTPQLDSVRLLVFLLSQLQTAVLGMKLLILPLITVTSFAEERSWY